MYMVGIIEDALAENRIQRARSSENMRAHKELKRLIDPQVKGIDKMGRIYVDRELPEQIVTIAVSPSETR